MPVKRGPYRRTPETREAIVAAAREVLSERGFYGMTIAEVAERCEMARSGLVYHFPSKEHLLLAVMEDRFEENTVWLEARLAEPGGDLLDTLVELMNRLAESPETATLVMVLGGASIDPANPAHKWYVGRYAAMRRRSIDYLRVGQDRGDIRKDLDAESMAAHLIAVIEGLLLQWLQDPDAVDMTKAMSDYRSLIRTAPAR